MKLSRLIIHEVIKNEIKTNSAIVDLSQNLLPISQNEVNFVDHLNKRYINSTQSHGIFSFGENDLFSDEFTKLRKELKTPAFIDFSTKSTQKLKEILDLTAPAKGGFLVFAEYEDYGSYIAVFLIRNRKGNQLVKSNNVYTIAEQIHVDIDNLAMACRINIKRIENEEDNYLSFINRKNEDSKFFLKWICATEVIRDKDDTKALISLLRKVTPPKVNGIDMTHSELCNTIYTHIRNNPRAEVSLEDIGQTLWENSSYLLEESNKHGIIISSIFKPDRTELRKLVNLQVTADSISISFPQEHLKGIVRVVGNQIIITSQNLATKINLEKIY